MSGEMNLFLFAHRPTKILVSVPVRSVFHDLLLGLEMKPRCSSLDMEGLSQGLPLTWN
ncbi:hypothetical protein M404DRAFT_1007206, partial [Pisolithus tinctorius Marx 270]